MGLHNGLGPMTFGHLAAQTKSWSFGVTQRERLCDEQLTAAATMPATCLPPRWLSCACTYCLWCHKRLLCLEVLRHKHGKRHKSVSGVSPRFILIFILVIKDWSMERCAKKKTKSSHSPPSHRSTTDVLGHFLRHFFCPAWHCWGEPVTGAGA